jgi:hypothetical protein
MRTTFDNESSIHEMSTKESAELAVLIKLNCNEWKFRGDKVDDQKNIREIVEKHPYTKEEWQRN